MPRTARFWTAAVAFAALVGLAAPQAFAQAQIPQADRQRAAQEHPKILEQFGGAYEGPQNRYVQDVGARTAAAAGVPGQCTFTLVNTDVVNAFAVPGCYVYVTRGLLGIVNSEDELAFVMGHEVGHIVARHAQSRQNRSLLSGLGAIILGAITKRDDLAELAATGAQLYTLSFSRSQEFEADDLASRYMARGGWDPSAGVDMLDDLQRHDALQARSRGRNDADAVPTWARTHPLTSDRMQRARNQAAAQGVRDVRRNREGYLRAVDGMIFGDDPAQGFVIGRTFAHPQMRIAFDAPQGFTLVNSPRAVLIENPNGLRAQFSMGQLSRGSLETYASQVLQQLVGQTPAQAGRAQRTTVNGMETVVLPARAQTQNGVVDITVVAYRASQDTAYHFISLAPSGRSGAFDPLFRSFRIMSPTEAASLRPRQIRVVTARNGDTVATMARRMAVDDLPAEWFAMLNNLPPNAALQPGQPVKLVEYAR